MKCVTGKIICLIALVSLLGCPALADTFTTVFKITDLVHQYELHTLYVGTNLTSPPSAGCTYSDHYALYDTSAAGDAYNAKLPLILAAYIHARPVSVALNGCTPNGYPKITQITIN